MAGVQLVWGRFQKLRLELSPLGAPTPQGPMPPLVTGHRWFMSFYYTSSQIRVVHYWIYHGLPHYLRLIMLCSSEILSPEPSQVHGIGCTERNNCPYDYYVIRFHEKKQWFLVDTPSKITRFWMFLLESVLQNLFLVDFHWRNPPTWQMDSHLCAQVPNQCQAETMAESNFCSVKAPSPKKRTIL